MKKYVILLISTALVIACVFTGANLLAPPVTEVTIYTAQVSEVENTVKCSGKIEETNKKDVVLGHAGGGIGSKGRRGGHGYRRPAAFLCGPAGHLYSAFLQQFHGLVPGCAGKPWDIQFLCCLRPPSNRALRSRAWMTFPEWSRPPFPAPSPA